MGVDSVAIIFERVPLHSGNYAATMSLCLRVNGNRGRPLNICYIIIYSFGQRTSALISFIQLELQRATVRLTLYLTI